MMVIYQSLLLLLFYTQIVMTSTINTPVRPPAAASVVVHPHILQPTTFACSKTSDCLALFNHTWCHSGLTCFKEICYRLPGYPCDHTQICHEVEHRCVSQPCLKRSDCDDHLFCNGVEQCVNSFCMPDYHFSCFYGLCSEENKTCTVPNALKTHTTSLTNQRIYSHETDTFTMRNHSHDDGGGINTSVNFAIICAASVVGVVVLILLIIAIVSK